MKVWILVREESKWESRPEIVGVFSSEKRAEKDIEESLSKYTYDIDEYEVEE